MVRVLNVNTGQVEHPHPLFQTWGEQIEWFVNRFHPEVANYVGMDTHGTHFCGRRKSDDDSPCGVVLLSRELKVEW